jgi:hypothetical protein
MKNILLLFCLLNFSNFLFSSKIKDQISADSDRRLSNLDEKCRCFRRENLLISFQVKSVINQALIDGYRKEIADLSDKLTGQKLAAKALMGADRVMRGRLKEELQVLKNQSEIAVKLIGKVFKVIKDDSFEGVKIPSAIVRRLQEALAERDKKRQAGTDELSSVELDQRSEMAQLQKRVMESEYLSDSYFKLISGEILAEDVRSNRRLAKFLGALERRDKKNREVALRHFEGIADNGIETPRSGPKTPEPETL